MALKYVVKKTTFGFDDTKAEKYVARPFNVVNVDFKMLCDQVTKVGFVPRGTVKAVLDGLIDSLITYMEIGASVNLGEFGTFRPSFGCKSQENAEEVTTETLKNRKIIFTPGEQQVKMYTQRAEKYDKVCQHSETGCNQKQQFCSFRWW